MGVIRRTEKIGTVVSIAVSINARHASLAARILRVLRPIAAVIHKSFTFWAKSRLCRFLFHDKPFLNTDPFLRCVLSD